jgi:predicted GNAT family acetyltransferase
MRVEPLTPALWPAFERLFGKQGACMGCWCMYWRMPHKAYDAARGDEAKRLFKRRVKAGPPPGVVAFDESGEAVGWLQIGPRADAPQWNSARRVSAPLKPDDVEDATVWAATCFFVKSGMRGQGVTEALLEGGIAFARENGARAVEACPMERDGRIEPMSLFVGHATVFKRAKFKEVARRKENRPLLRLQLKPPISRKRMGKSGDTV